MEYIIPVSVNPELYVGLHVINTGCGSAWRPPLRPDWSLDIAVATAIGPRPIGVDPDKKLGGGTNWCV